MAKPKIIFLDAATVDWRDQKFEPLKRIGELKTYSLVPAAKLLSSIHGFSHVITNKVVLNREIISKLKGVRAIHVAATGVNNVDLVAAREAGIAVTNVRGYSTESVVQVTFAALLSLSVRLREYDAAVRGGAWSRQPFFALNSLPFFELAGKTLGVVGYGTIGQRVAAVAGSLGMKVLIAKLPGRAYSGKDAKERLPLASVLKASDFLTIHTPLSDLTRDLIGKREIGLMKKSAFLLNMARGGIVNESALAVALKSRKIAGAASDVLTCEPPPRGHVLYNAPNLLLTPHIAWASFEARTRLVQEVASNITSFEKGGKRNRLV